MLYIGFVSLYLEFYIYVNYIGEIRYDTVERLVFIRLELEIILSAYLTCHKIISLSQYCRMFLNWITENP